MKKYIIKCFNQIKRFFVFIKNKTATPRAFLHSGRCGGIIACLLLATQFFTWIFNELSLEKIPRIFVFILTGILIFLFVELFNLILRLIFGSSRRPLTYFLFAAFVVGTNNCAAQQGNSIPAALLMTFALVFAADLLGRCIWSFIKTRRFNQVFAYIAGGLSLVYVIFYGIYFHFDFWGKSRIEFYNQIKNENSVKPAKKFTGFENFLSDGSCKVLTLSYGPEDTADIITETVDYSGFDSMENRDFFDKIVAFFSDYDYSKTPVRGQIWYPEGKKNCPTFFIVHGAHDSTVPSYLGYEYLGKYLASNGYIVISVDENIINELGEGNDKRAILLLDNMKAILAENENSSSPLYGLINANHISIGGHSRGGEMVATAYLFNDLETYPEDGNFSFDYHFNISSIVAIAPVVDQYKPVDHSVKIKDVSYLLIHGSNDQDVSNMMGEKQYKNLEFTGNTEKTYFKSSVYILGANHGQFNSQWGRYDLTSGTNGFLNTNHFLDEAEQKLIAKAYIRSFLDTTIGDDDTYYSLLKNTNGYEEYLPDTVYITNYSDSSFVSLCSFDDTTDIKNPEKEIKVTVSDSDTWTIKPYKRGNGGEAEDFVLSAKWNENTNPLIRIDFSSIDISKGCLSFAIADMNENTEKITEGINYKISLTDAFGRTIFFSNPKFIYPSLAVQLYKQDVFFNNYEYKHQLQTVRITPDLFDKTATNAFDFSKVESLIIRLDGTKQGELIINDISYTKAFD